jgi:hypothetical protein
MGKPFGEASRRTFGRIGTLVPFPCWNSLGVMSSDTLKFSKQPPSEALKGGLPVSVLQLSGLLTPSLIQMEREVMINQITEESIIG